MRRAAEAMLEPVMGAIQQLGQRITHQQMAGVVDRAAAAVSQHAPAFASVTSHPDFPAAFRQVLSSVPPEQWEDSRVLARVALSLAADLPEPQGGWQARAAQPTRAGAQPGQSVVSRAAAVVAGPSRDAGRGARKPQVTDLHRAVAERISLQTGREVTAEEIAMSEGDPTGDRAAAMRAKRLAGER